MFREIYLFSKKKYLFKRKWSLMGIFCLLLLIVMSAIFLASSMKENKNFSSHPSSRRSGQTSTIYIATPTLNATPSLTPTPLFFDDFMKRSQGWALSGVDDTSGYLRTRVNNQLVLSD